jgi:hypothetical protein
LIFFLATNYKDLLFFVLISFCYFLFEFPPFFLFSVPENRIVAKVERSRIPCRRGNK